MRELRELRSCESRAQGQCPQLSMNETYQTSTKSPPTRLKPPSGCQVRSLADPRLSVAFCILLLCLCFRSCCASIHPRIPHRFKKFSASRVERVIHSTHVSSSSPPSWCVLGDASIFRTILLIFVHNLCALCCVKVYVPLPYTTVALTNICGCHIEQF